MHGYMVQAAAWLGKRLQMRAALSHSAPSNAARGVAAEQAACSALTHDGWSVLGRRLRTKAGEVDAVAEKDGLIAFVEVKSRSSLAEAAHALGARQQTRLMAAAEILLAENPSWGRTGVRFDVLLVDRQFRVRRVPDAFRLQ